MVLIPNVMAMYAKRNPSLASFTVEAIHKGQDVRVIPEALEPFRQDPQFSKLGQLLEGIAAFQNLNHFQISDVPFLSVDIVPRILETCQALPLLRSLVVNPDCVSEIEADRLTLPGLDALEYIANHSQNLERLEILLALSQGIQVPSIPGDDVATPTRRLTRLGFHAFGEMDCTMEEKFDMARYIEHLFPEARIYSPIPGECDFNAFWAFIDQLLSFSRASRAQAIRQLERSQMQE
jgi:hypothetical protein